MELKDLFSFVLMLVIVGMIIGIGVIIFDKFGQSTAMTTTANTTITSMRTEIANISSNWLGLIVTVAILAIILTLVIRSFGAGAGR